MADIDSGGGSHHGGKHDKKRAKKQSTRVDMTPMVDLAFLLLTFFVLTATFNKSRVLEYNLPAPLKDITQAKEVKNAITIILSEKGSVYYYTGELGKASKLEASNFKKDGISQVLADLNKSNIDSMNIITNLFRTNKMADSIYEKESKRIRSKIGSLVVILKYDDKASYKSVIDLVDEVKLNYVGTFVPTDKLEPKEEILLAAAKAYNSEDNGTGK